MKLNYRSVASVAGIAALLLLGVAGVSQSRAKKQPYTIQIEDVGAFTVDAKVRNAEDYTKGAREYFDFTLRPESGGEIVLKHARISYTKSGIHVQLLP